MNKSTTLDIKLFFYNCFVFATLNYLRYIRYTELKRKLNFASGLQKLQGIVTPSLNNKKFSFSVCRSRYRACKNSYYSEMQRLQTGEHIDVGIPRNFMLLKQNETRKETKPQLHQLCGLLSFTQIINSFCHLSVSSGQNTMLFPLYSDQSQPNTSRRHGKPVPYAPTLEQTQYRGKQLACPPDSPHCTQHVHFQTSTPIFPNRKPVCDQPHMRRLYFKSAKTDELHSFAQNELFCIPLVQCPYNRKTPLAHSALDQIIFCYFFLFLHCKSGSTL